MAAFLLRNTMLLIAGDRTQLLPANRASNQAAYAEQTANKGSSTGLH